MSTQEKEKCEQLILLFQDVINLEEDFHYCYCENLGYLILQFLTKNSAETTYICYSAEDMYHYFQNTWENTMIYCHLTKRAIYNYPKENAWNLLTPDFQKYIFEQRIFYTNKGLKIVNG